jgi:tetratricopeptide (TPR) repeat protein
MALTSAGRVNPGIEHFQAAIRLKADYFEAYDNLARTLAVANRFDQAVETARRGITAARSAADEASAKRIDETLRAIQQKQRPK